MRLLMLLSLTLCTNLASAQTPEPASVVKLSAIDYTQTASAQVLKSEIGNYELGVVQTPGLLPPTVAPDSAFANFPVVKPDPSVCYYKKAVIKEATEQAYLVEVAIGRGACGQAPMAVFARKLQ